MSNIMGGKCPVFPDGLSASKKARLFCCLHENIARGKLFYFSSRMSVGIAFFYLVKQMVNYLIFLLQTTTNMIDLVICKIVLHPRPLAVL